MANVKLEWTLPTTRFPSGRPLAVADIAAVEIAQGVDGSSYGVIDVLLPTQLSTVVTDLEPGEWFFRGVVIDKGGKRSAPKTGSIVVPDESGPGELLAFTLTLA